MKSKKKELSNSISYTVTAEEYKKRILKEHETRDIESLQSAIKSNPLPSFRVRWKKWKVWLNKFRSKYDGVRWWKNTWPSSEYVEDGYTLKREPEDMIHLIRRFEHDIKCQIDYYEFAGDDPLPVPTNWSELEEMENNIEEWMKQFSLEQSKMKNYLVKLLIKRWSEKIGVHIRSYRLEGTTSKEVQATKPNIKRSDLYYPFKKPVLCLYGKKDEKGMIVGLRYDTKSDSVFGVGEKMKKDKHGISRRETYPVDELKLIKKDIG